MILSSKDEENQRWFRNVYAMHHTGWIHCFNKDIGKFLQHNNHKNGYLEGMYYRLSVVQEVGEDGVSKQPLAFEVKTVLP